MARQVEGDIEALAAVASSILIEDEVPELVGPVQAVAGPDPEAAAIQARVGPVPSDFERLGQLLTVDADTPARAAIALDLAWAGWFVGQEDWTAALFRAERALRQEPENSTGHWLAANSLAQLERREEAIGHLRLIADIEPDEPDTMSLIAELVSDLGEPDLARRWAQRAWGLTRSTPMSPAAQRTLGLTMSELGDKAMAKDVLGTLASELADANAPSFDPDVLAATATTLAQVLLSDNEVEQARRVLAEAETRLSSLDQYPVAQFLMAAALVRLGQPIEALGRADATLMTALAGGPYEPEAKYLRAVAQVQRAEIDGDTTGLPEAVQVLEAVVEPEAMFLHAAALLGLGRSDEARKVLDLLEVSLSPDSSAELRGRAACLRGIAWNGIDSERASADLEEADRLLPVGDPQRTLVTLLLAARLSRDDPDRALALVASAGPIPAPLMALAIGTEVQARLASGSLHAALELFDRWLELCPAAERGPILLERVATKWQLNDRDGAWNDLEEARKAGDGDHGLMWQVDAREVVLRLAEGDLPKAATLVDDLASRANDADRRSLLGLRLRVAAAESNTDQIFALVSALADDENGVGEYSTLAHYMRGEQALLAGNLVQYRAELEQVATGPRPEATAYEIVLVANARSILDDNSDVAHQLDHAAVLDPAVSDWPLTRLTRALDHVRRGEVTEVIAALDGLDSVDQRLRHLFLASARSVRRPPDFRGALDDLDQVVATAPSAQDHLGKLQVAQAHAQRAIVLVATGQFQTASEALTATMQASDGLPEGVHTILRFEAEGVLAMRQDRFDEAANALQQAVTIARAFAGPPVAGSGPKSPLVATLAYLQGVNQLLAGRPEDALRHLREADANDPDVLEAIGDAHLSLDDAHQALIAYQRALAETTDDARRPGRMLDTARALCNLGRHDSALGAARDALELAPNSARGWLVLATAHQAAGHHDAAISAYHQSLHHEPGNQTTAQALVGLSKAYLDTNRAAEAVRVLRDERYREVRSHFGSVTFNLALALLATNRSNAAIEELKAASRAAEPANDARSVAAAIRAQQAERGSWLGFWFSGQTAARRLIGSGLLALGAAFTALIVIDKTAHWLWWVDSSAGNRLLTPLAAIAALYLLPVVTKLKLGGLELEQPAPKATEPATLSPINWDEVGRKMLATTPTSANSEVASTPPTATITTPGQRTHLPALPIPAVLPVPTVHLPTSPQSPPPASS